MNSTNTDSADSRSLCWAANGINCKPKCAHDAPLSVLAVQFIPELLVPARSGSIEFMVQKTENTEEAVAFSERVKKALIDLGMNPDRSGAWLAAKMNVSNKGALKWLQADSIPKTSTIKKLAEVLNVSPWWLLFGEAVSDRPVTIEPEERAILETWHLLQPHEQIFWLGNARQILEQRASTTSLAITGPPKNLSGETEMRGMKSITS